MMNQGKRGDTLKLTLLFILTAGLQWGATAGEKRTVNDALWIWGHPPTDAFNNSYFKPIGRRSTIEPVPAAQDMGISNMMFICYQGTPKPPFDEYYTPLRQMGRVYWSLVAAEGATSEATREAAFSLAEKNENIVGWILDDFFHESGGVSADNSLSTPASAQTAQLRASLTPAELRSLRKRKVRGRQLPLMAVIYDGQLKPGAQAHIAEVDQLCLWTSRPADLKNLETNLAVLEKLAPGKELFLGCYMYDFDGRKPLAVDLMRYQTELGYRWLKEGRIAGMIFLATSNVDIGLEAVDWTRNWIRETGNQVIEKCPKEKK